LLQQPADQGACHVAAADKGDVHGLVLKPRAGARMDNFAVNRLR
jgi:hypothetical protein